METTEAGIATLNLGQVYISIADPAADGTIPARIYWKPLVTLIWLGALLMAFAGALSLTDRRLRIGAPARAKSAAAQVATG
jgi:cytochrome c-type biogenesis protein CcmF